ncbi:MAG: GAF domain-containing protein [Anaerolineales bacterium]|nr:GAF domain-containing protein [Anaerolineales bacterium]
MLKAIRGLFQPPVFKDREQNRLGGLLHTITLWSWLVPFSLVLIPMLFPAFRSRSTPAAVLVIFFNIIVTVLNRRGYVKAASSIFVISLAGVITYVSISFAAQPRPYIIFFAWIIIFAGLLLGSNAATAAAVYFALIQTTIIILVENGILQSVNAQLSPIGNTFVLVVGFLLISSTINLASRNIQNLDLKTREDEQNLKSSNKELIDLTNNLEKRIAERTKELENANLRIEKRARQFQTISQVTRAIISTQNMQDLLPQVVQVISQQFDFYHIGIFLIDLNGEYAVLSAANSAGGEKMLERSHKLRIGQTGIVGYVAKTGKVRIALDTGADAIYFNNPDLPETRSEMALPLFQSNGEIIGVLDIQSTVPNAFYQEDIEILTTLADQVSVAIVNARQYEETQKSLIEADMSYRQELKIGWNKFSRSQKLAGIRRRGMKSSFLADPLELPGVRQVIQTGSMYQEKVESTGISHLTMPVTLRGEAVGILNLKTNIDREWSADEIDIINAIIERAALAIENARLLDESRKIAERELAISDISAKIGKGTEIETILKTAVRELGAQISGAQVTVEIGGGNE